MRKSKNLKHISRVEQEKKNQYGWLVRITRNGVTHQKFFYDSVYGGKNSALLAAMARRDDWLQKYPKPQHGNLFNRLTSRNTSNYPGVNRTRTSKRGVYYDMWQASWTLPDGKIVSRKFHFSSTGRTEEEALRLAIKARQQGVKMIERLRRNPKSTSGVKRAKVK